ncbi:MAG: zinc ribbon domain-containing protein [Deltaproteobacteria bacterium]|jgi:putative FmdB family regulatory protein|nr:zinc ribbon domain-containing protein [Deltaproteobacteria bacterium]RPJ05216.1 MAG: zinc ribbon domain-containing protein [Deltaproteobacteria bacterium]
MPIYEFKCLKCNECFEILVMNAKDSVETRCPACGAEDFERILSCASYSMDGSAGAGQGVKSQTRNCSGGSCSTLEIPGPSR